MQRFFYSCLALIIIIIIIIIIITLNGIISYSIRCYGTSRFCFHYIYYF